MTVFAFVPRSSLLATLLRGDVTRPRHGPSAERRLRSRAESVHRLPARTCAKPQPSIISPSAGSHESCHTPIKAAAAARNRDPAFNRTAVLRYRFFLERDNPARSTIKGRPVAVHRSAYEAADTVLPSPELAAGIRRMKGRRILQGDKR
jgi:hypothetical protein